MHIPAPLRLVSEVAWRLLVIVAAIAVVGYVLITLRLVIVPVVVALMLATLLVPPRRQLERLGLPRTLAAVLVFLAAVGAAAVAGFLLVPVIENDMDALDTFEVDYQLGIDRAEQFLTEGPLDLSEERVRQLREQLQTELEGQAGNILGGVFSQGLLLIELLVSLALAVVLAFFFVRDGEQIADWLARLAPRANEDDMREVFARQWSAVGGYLRGVLATGLTEASLVGLVLFLIGVPFVVPLAALTFLGSFVPIVGAFASGAVAVVVALLAAGPKTALVTLGLFFAVQQLEGNVLTPLYVGRAVHIHPLAVLLAVTIGGSLWGIAGAFVAVPILLAVVTWVGYLGERYEGGEDDGFALP